MKESEMSRTAQNLIELLRLAHGDAGALTQHLLRELAAQLIAPRMVGHGRLAQSHPL
jgi:hypothetical protein